MNKYFLVGIFMFFRLTATAQSEGLQIPPELTDGVRIETHSTLYNQAYLEIADMLDGNTELSIKRAVFLHEWAYLDGELDYNWYCTKIDDAAAYLNRFIAANELDRYKTGKNLALYDYFTRPLSGNGHKAFTYDMSEAAEQEGFAERFVTKVIRTNTGQCHSLPTYYRILAEAIGSEAYLSLAPQHAFISYRNYDNFFPEDWVNVELTTHQIQPEFWIIEHSGINRTMIENKVYLQPLSVSETVAYQLVELAWGYMDKYGDCDDFMWLCAIKSLEYFPRNLRAINLKGFCINSLLASTSRTTVTGGIPMRVCSQTNYSNWRNI
ncbi:MAG: hypothetical protein LIO77_01865 [Rikenellaceae bacterium]|nr:hypothetical protein [Rikenellaceae bacterium]